ncbi:putative carboxylesterase [Ananas comosus]|uniref:Putative carboxylesterase n=1 Tax=Ananas comosus TaxID=4615 RepID=A0A199UGM4_ANACO|nr:putative carboxylesterase [Ananas comosus]
MSLRSCPSSLLLPRLRPSSLAVLAFTVFASAFLLLPRRSAVNPPPPPPPPSPSMAARSFVLWLHGLGDSGPANEPIRTFFTFPEFNLTKWAFPSAPHAPVSCNYGAIMPSWFDIHEIPVAAVSPKDEKGVLKAVENVHAMIDREVAAGINPENIFVCGFSQGGALTLASVLLYPKTLGGGAVFSGWVPFNSSIIERISPEARKTPILWSHGMADRTVLFEAGQAGPPFLQQAGISCEFKAYPDLGHSITPEELRSLESWIKSRLKSSS